MKFINDYLKYLESLSIKDLSTYLFAIDIIVSNDYYSDFYKRSFNLIRTMIISELERRNIVV